jgi:Undecaprenyl-phosphate glucose phosphotransferase
VSYYLRENIKYLFLLFFSLLITWKYLLYFAFYFYRKQGFSFSNVVILGYSPRTDELANYLVNNKWHGYRFLGFFDESRNPKGMTFRPWHELRTFIENNEVHEVYISWTRVPREVIPMVTDIISEFPLKVRIIPDLGNFSFKSAEVINYGMIPVVQIHPGPLSYWYNRWIKRFFDIVLSLAVILGLLSWISLLLFLVDLFTSREGVFFRQKRTAIDGKAFYCYKFRSMRKNREADLVQATRDDERITPLGRFLRKTSIDELPQFFNVLLGQMSVVGPRPHMLKHTDLYRKIVKRFMLRHTIKPGITGLAQVNGCRGEIRNRSDIRKRVEFDMNYIENWSFKLDLKIIVLTIWLMIRGQDKAF